MLPSASNITTVIDTFIGDMFEHLDGRDLYKEEEDYFDAAKACRDAQTRMNKTTCGGVADEDCIFNVLVPALDLLQRWAYEEILTSLSESVINTLHSIESSASARGAIVTSMSNSGMGVVSQRPALSVVGHTHLPSVGRTSQRRIISAVNASISVVAK